MNEEKSQSIDKGPERREDDFAQPDDMPPGLDHAWEKKDTIDETTQSHVGIVPKMRLPGETDGGPRAKEKSKSLGLITG